MKYSIGARVFRRMAEQTEPERIAGLKEPEGLRVLDDLSYGTDESHRYDLYRPQGEEVLPLLIHVHGGAYVCSDKEYYRYYCMALAKQGFCVVNFNYRLAPRFRFPAPLEDLHALLARLLEQAEDFAFDPARLVLAGDSAGAQIVSQYAALCTNADYARVMGIRPHPVEIRALGLNCGLYHLSGFFQTKAALLLLKDYLTEDPSVFGERLRVKKYITHRFPPSFLLSSPGDFLLPCFRDMARLLQRLGVKHRAELYGTVKDQHVFHLDIKKPVARQALEDEAAFFREMTR